ncbi:MAG: hypothetical protein COA42_14535 [Alteromonadaceae bacterium]|nr:MAG: hypothetical protein COA42_14535 [Alteromonadaceae bacterium]
MLSQDLTPLLPLYILLSQDLTPIYILPKKRGFSVGSLLLPFSMVSKILLYRPIYDETLN